MKITYTYDFTTDAMLYRYFDENGAEIFDGDMVEFNGKVQKVYLTENGELGTDATNPLWVQSGRAVECEWGIYPFEETDEPIKVKL